MNKTTCDVCGTILQQNGEDKNGGVHAGRCEWRQALSGSVQESISLELCDVCSGHMIHAVRVWAENIEQWDDRMGIERGSEGFPKELTVGKYFNQEASRADSEDQS